MKILIFDTHPIQYRSPIFRKIYQKEEDFLVIFFNERFDFRKWWFHETPKMKPQNFSLPLKEGFPNRSLNTDTLGLVKTYLTIKNIFITENPSAVLIYGYYLPEHWIIRYIAIKRKVPLFFIGETFDTSGSFLRRLIKPHIQKFFLNKMTSIISIGEKNYRHYINLGIPKNKIINAKYSVDTSFFSLEKETALSLRKESREKLLIPMDAFTLLFVGRLFNRKRPFDVISIHEKLSSKYNVYSIIVGDGPLFSRIKELAPPKLLVVGFKNQSEIQKFYYMSDLLILPSEYETWGLVVNEAFSTGLPAIVTEKCGVANELVIEGKTGFIFKVGDIEVAVKKIESLILNKELYNALSKNAKNLIERDYSVEAFSDVIFRAMTKKS